MSYNQVSQNSDRKSVVKRSAAESWKEKEDEAIVELGAIGAVPESNLVDNKSLKKQ